MIRAAEILAVIVVAMVLVTGQHWFAIGLWFVLAAVMYFVRGFAVGYRRARAR